MLAWINFFIMIISSILFFYFYVKNVDPAALEKKTGKSAYEKCAFYRKLAIFFEIFVAINYIVYFFIPITIFSALQTFPWDWWISITSAIIIAIPTGILMIVSGFETGKKAIAPQKDQQLYSGIYKWVRHPGALGEVFWWWIIALILHSPFLFLYSIIFFLIFYLMCVAEEKDLVVRFGEAYEEYRNSTGMFFPKRK